MSLKVKDVMVDEVISVSEGTTIQEAAQLLDKHTIGCIVVVDNDKPVGIVTETDLVKSVILKSMDSTRTRVSEIMSRPIVVGHPQMAINEASELMRQRNIKKLPIIANKRLVGLITTTDIVRSPEVLKLMVQAIKRNVVKEIILAIQEKLDL